MRLIYLVFARYSTSLYQEYFYLRPHKEGDFCSGVKLDAHARQITFHKIQVFIPCCVLVVLGQQVDCVPIYSDG